MADYTSSAMASSVVPPSHVYGQTAQSVTYTGTFSASVSDAIQMMKLPRKAVVDLVIVGGTVAATAATLQVGDDAGSKTRYGSVSLSNATSQVMAPGGSGFRYSLSDDDATVTLLLTASANTSASGSCSVYMTAFYHMP